VSWTWLPCCITVDCGPQYDDVSSVLLRFLVTNVAGSSDLHVAICLHSEVVDDASSPLSMSAPISDSVSSSELGVSMDAEDSLIVVRGTLVGPKS
jgi:hypothetical protein